MNENEEIEGKVEEFKTLIVPELSRGELEERIVEYHRTLLKYQMIINKVDKLIN